MEPTNMPVMQFRSIIGVFAASINICCISADLYWVGGDFEVGDGMEMLGMYMVAGMESVARDGECRRLVEGV
jgi:hypothetical protein